MYARYEIALKYLAAKKAEKARKRRGLCKVVAVIVATIIIGIAILIIF